jgi:hypothetical protein
VDWVTDLTDFVISHTSEVFHGIQQLDVSSASVEEVVFQIHLEGVQGRFDGAPVGRRSSAYAVGWVGATARCDVARKRCDHDDPSPIYC